MSTFKVGLIICDTPVPTVVEKYGDYNVIFNAFFQSCFQGLQLQDKQLQLVPYYAHQNSLPPLENDLLGYIITGSSYSAYSSEPWIEDLVQFIKDSLKSDKKWLGVCFGFQILARALQNDAVIKNPLGWEVGPLDIKLTEEGKKFLNTDQDSLCIQQMHQDHVPHLPPNCKLLASSNVSPVQGYVIPNQMIAVQGHPEFFDDIVQKIVDKRTQANIFNLQQKEEVESRLCIKHDGLHIGKAMLKFLLEAK